MQSGFELLRKKSFYIKKHNNKNPYDVSWFQSETLWFLVQLILTPQKCNNLFWLQLDCLKSKIVIMSGT